VADKYGEREQHLQKAPLGLLGALNLKVGGDNPDGFSKCLQATFDATQLYTAEFVNQAINASVGEVAGSSLTIDVDSAHAWLMRAVSARWDFQPTFTTTVQQTRFSLQYIPSKNSTGAPGAQFYFATTTHSVADFGTLPLGAGITYSVFLHAHFPQPFLLLPGSTLQMSTNSVATAGTYNTAIRADVAAIAL
jgi:hypothetical protein